MERPVFLIDIDQTLAGGIVGTQLKHYNNRLQLGLKPKDIEFADYRYDNTFSVPSIDKYRRTPGGEKKFQEAREAIRTSTPVHFDYKTLPGAQKGVFELLAETDAVFGGYYTGRPVEVDFTTTEWLDRNGFLYPNQVVHCANDNDKLQKILDRFIPFDATEDIDVQRNVILIDDNYENLIFGARHMVRVDETLRARFKNLILVGFGLDNINFLPDGEFDDESGVRSVGFSSWDDKRGFDALAKKIK